MFCQKSVRVVGGLGCGWVKLNVLQKRWLACRLAALLILRSVGNFRLFVGMLNVCRVSHNVLGLCVRAGFGAQNCLPALHLIRSTKLQVCTSPRLTQNPCYSQCFFVIRLFMVFLSNLSICPL